MWDAWRDVRRRRLAVADGRVARLGRSRRRPRDRHQLRGLSAAGASVPAGSGGRGDAGGSASQDVRPRLRRRLHRHRRRRHPAAVGNRIAAAVIAFGLADGANEAGNYADPTYVPINPPLVVKLPGTVVADPNRWQPLALDVIVTQNGIPLPDKVQTYIGARWNQVTPFALTRSDPNDVYIDPGPPPFLGTPERGGLQGGCAARARAVEPPHARRRRHDRHLAGRAWQQPARHQRRHRAHREPGHGTALRTAARPARRLRARARRVLGGRSRSETPPGHWNVLANDASDHPLMAHRIGGTGPGCSTGSNGT